MAEETREFEHRRKTIPGGLCVKCGTVTEKCVLDVNVPPAALKLVDDLEQPMCPDCLTKMILDASPGLEAPSTTTMRLEVGPTDRELEQTVELLTGVAAMLSDLPEQHPTDEEWLALRSILGGTGFALYRRAAVMTAVIEREKGTFENRLEQLMLSHGSTLKH